MVLGREKISSEVSRIPRDSCKDFCKNLWILGMRRITELAVNRPDVYYPVRKNTKPFNRKYFFFPCVSTHTHSKQKLCWKYTHLLRNVIQKREKMMFSKHLLPTIIIFSPYFCSLIDELTCTALTFLYGSLLAWFLLSANLIKFPLCKCINCQTSYGQ